ncbi:MAG: hypothetical protein ACXVB0_24355 [Mucilaginibacter sp.]
MKVKTPLLVVALSLLFCVPCYAEAPGAMVGSLMVFLLMIGVCGIILGFLVKVVFFYARVSAANWQIFLGSILAAALILIMLFKQ